MLEASLYYTNGYEWEVGVWGSGLLGLAGLVW